MNLKPNLMKFIMKYICVQAESQNSFKLVKKSCLKLMLDISRDVKSDVSLNQWITFTPRVGKKAIFREFFKALRDLCTQNSKEKATCVKLTWVCAYLQVLPAWLVMWSQRFGWQGFWKTPEGGTWTRLQQVLLQTHFFSIQCYDTKRVLYAACIVHGIYTYCVKEICIYCKWMDW